MTALSDCDIILHLFILILKTQQLFFLALRRKWTEAPNFPSVNNSGMGPEIKLSAEEPPNKNNSCFNYLCKFIYEFYTCALEDEWWIEKEK